MTESLKRRSTRIAVGSVFIAFGAIGLVASGLTPDAGSSCRIDGVESHSQFANTIPWMAAACLLAMAAAFTHWRVKGAGRFRHALQGG